MQGRLNLELSDKENFLHAGYYFELCLYKYPQRGKQGNAGHEIKILIICLIEPNVSREINSLDVVISFLPTAIVWEH